MVGRKDEARSEVGSRRDIRDLWNRLCAGAVAAETHSEPTKLGRYSNQHDI